MWVQSQYLVHKIKTFSGRVRSLLEVKSLMYLALCSIGTVRKSQSRRMTAQFCNSRYDELQSLKVCHLRVGRYCGRVCEPCAHIKKFSGSAYTLGYYLRTVAQRLRGGYPSTQLPHCSE